jgi:flagellar biosynthesis/type III secretory pathway protein FliH
MDQKAIHRLDAEAQKLAEKLGVHASVSLAEGDEAGLDPGSPRVVLKVFHDGAAALQTEFRTDAADLRARIEQEIPVLAQELARH